MSNYVLISENELYTLVDRLWMSVATLDKAVWLMNQLEPKLSGMAWETAREIVEAAQFVADEPKALEAEVGK